MQQMILQFRQTPRSILSSMHNDERTPSRRYQVDAHDIAELPESIRQILLMYQFRQMPHPQRSAAN